MALRLRKDGSKWLQTLKTAGVATGGLHKRGEWEHSPRIPQLDLSLFRETPLAALAQSKALHLTLKPAFTTEFHRTTWCLEMSPGERVEVALALLGEIALAPEILSKAERGYRLFRPASPAPLQAEAIELKRNWPPHQAMSAIIAGAVGHFGANVEGAIASDDPEYVHQLRVALRRLRFAIRIFRPTNAEPIVTELKWLTAVLGDARDWDVLVTKTLPALLEAGGDQALGMGLLSAAKQRQGEARDVARVAPRLAARNRFAADYRPLARRSRAAPALVRARQWCWRCRTEAGGIQPRALCVA